MEKLAPEAGSLPFRKWRAERARTGRLATFFFPAPLLLFTPGAPKIAPPTPVPPAVPAMFLISHLLLYPQ
jgi:hypothetical protein